MLKWLRMDKENHFRRGAKMIREAADDGAKSVVTTECLLDGFMNGDRAIPLAMVSGLGRTRSRGMPQLHREQTPCRCVHARPPGLRSVRAKNGDKRPRRETCS